MRVGIITLFHNSINYGGVLQAYALSRVLSELQISNEQICYSMESGAAVSGKGRLKQKLVKLLNPLAVMRFVRSRIGLIRASKVKRQLASRIQAFHDFGNRYIPHTEKVYNAANIRECCSRYSAFITGSDQVWNPDWYHSSMFLDFVPEGVPKISYAASLGKSRLSEQQKPLFREHLKDFTAISVREKDAVELLQPLSPVRVEWVLDPTLLLSREQWDAVCADRIAEGDYMFCYFLGENARDRRLAEQYASKHGLKIVRIPHASSNYTRRDKIRDAEELWDVSPAGFLSLIKHAKCIFTDSFHACVFSAVYEKECFVFQRSNGKGMSSRIYSLTSLFGSEDHFLDTDGKAGLKYIDKLQRIDYSKTRDGFEQLKEKSLDYLRKSLAAPGAEKGGQGVTAS